MIVLEWIIYKAGNLNSRKDRNSRNLHRQFPKLFQSALRLSVTIIAQRIIFKNQKEKLPCLIIQNLKKKKSHTPHRERKLGELAHGPESMDLDAPSVFTSFRSTSSLQSTLSLSKKKKKKLTPPAHAPLVKVM